MPGHARGVEICGRPRQPAPETSRKSLQCRAFTGPPTHKGTCRVRPRPPRMPGNRTTFRDPAAMGCLQIRPESGPESGPELGTYVAGPESAAPGIEFAVMHNWPKRLTESASGRRRANPGSRNCFVTYCFDGNISDWLKLGQWGSPVGDASARWPAGAGNPQSFPQILWISGNCRSSQRVIPYCAQLT